MAKREQLGSNSDAAERWREGLSVTHHEPGGQEPAWGEWLDVEDLGLQRLPVAELARDGWEPVDDDVLVTVGTTVKHVQLLDTVSGGDIEDDTLRLARITLVGPDGERATLARLYCRGRAGPGAEDFAAFGAVLRAKLGEADLCALAARLLGELAQDLRIAETLSEPTALRSASARKGFWRYVEVKQDLSSLEGVLSEHASGAMYVDVLRRAIDDAYRIGRWAREMELAEPLQPLINRGRDGRTADAKENGEKGGRKRTEDAADRWERAGYLIWRELEPAWGNQSDVRVATEVLHRLDAVGVQNLPEIERARKVVARWKRGGRPPGA